MHEPISFRNGIEGTPAVARVVLEREPMDGALFVFRNKADKMSRILLLRRQRILAPCEASLEGALFGMASS